MAYIRKIIGSDEKLVGIARLHWIYILKGTLWLLACMAFAWAVNSGILYLTHFLMETRGDLGTSATPFYLINTWITPFMLITGLILLSFYVVKVITTEIGLTTSRLIHKYGFIFVKVQEIDINEISGEALDLGMFGRFWGYGYLNLDCRFIGDVHLPAIEHPERFVRVLHQLRADTADTPSMAMTKAKTEQHATPPDDNAVKGHDLKVPELKADAPAADPEMVEQIIRQVQAEIVQTPQAAAPVDARMVADIVQKAMPQMVEQVAENLRAKGLIPDQDTQEQSPEEELQSSFDEAAGEAMGKAPPDAKDEFAKVIH